MTAQQRKKTNYGKKLALDRCRQYAVTKGIADSAEVVRAKRKARLVKAKQPNLSDKSPPSVSRSNPRPRGRLSGKAAFLGRPYSHAEASSL